MMRKTSPQLTMSWPAQSGGPKAVDLFAGWGGFTLGAASAGVDVVWAANHWPLAVEAHSLNHPTAVHSCQDLRQADWTALPAYSILLASPACQGFSQASQPKRRRYHDALRATPWAVLDCADVTRPESVIVENVLDFQSSWDLYPLWRKGFEILGYHCQEVVLTASLMGVPQRRKRLFFVATRKAVDLRGLESRTESPFGPCIDWTAPADWRPVRVASDRVRERIAKGRRNHGKRFLTQHVTGHPGVSLDEPIRTVTTKDQWALVDGDRYRPLTVRENARAMGFPDSYTWPESSSRRDQIKGLGNAVCPPVATQLLERIAA